MPRPRFDDQSAMLAVSLAILVAVVCFLLGEWLRRGA